MPPAKPRRAVLRKAADSDIHPAEPRVNAQPVRAKAPAKAPVKAAATRTARSRPDAD